MRTSLRGVVNRKLTLASSAGALVALLAMAGTAWTDEVFKATSIVTGFASGTKISSFDISYVDSKLHQYFLADRTNKAVDVADTDGNALVNQLGKGTFAGFSGNNDSSGPNGVLTVDHKEVWVGDGPTITPPTGILPPSPPTTTAATSTVKVFDATTGALTHTINTGGYLRADEGCYDPRNHVVVMANDAEHDYSNNWPYISFISTEGPKAYTVIGKITMDGTGDSPKATNGIEQCQWSEATGKLYVNIPEVNGPGDDSVAGAVLVIDPKAMKIEQIWFISHDVCAGPQGMAIGPDNQILLGCNQASGNGKFSTVIINERSGGVIRVLNNESGADEVWYNPGDGHYFLGRSKALGPATPPATVPVAIDSYLGVIDSTGESEDQSIDIGSPTAASHSVAADPHKNQVYVPIPANTTPASPALPVTSTVCGSVTGGSDTLGCIAIFTTTHDDRPTVARERDHHRDGDDRYARDDYHDK